MKFKLLVVSFLLTLSVIASYGNPSALLSNEPLSHSQTLAMASPSNQNVTVFVNPNATIDLSRTQSKITVEVGLNNTGPNGPKYNSISVVISYNPHVVNATIRNVQVGSLDYSANVFSSFPQVAVLRDCLDGLPANNGGTNLCGSDDRAGRVSFAETIIGGSTPNGTQGALFLLTLVTNTTAPNFSLINIDQAIVSEGNIQLPTTTLNGYYSSLKCGSVACSLAHPDFTFSPRSPRAGSFVVFYANTSIATGGGTITDYFWTFGDTLSLRPYQDSGTNSTTSYIYQGAGTYTVTLYITDSFQVRSTKSLQITIHNANIDMGIESLNVQPSVTGLNPGVVFNITAILKNYGGVAENTSLLLSILVNGKTKQLGNFIAMNVKPGTDRSYSATWDSSGVTPNVYRVDAITPVLTNETITDPNPNQRSYWIQLIPIQPSGGLTLLGTAGLSVLVLGAGGASVSFIRKRTRVVDDLL